MPADVETVNEQEEGPDVAAAAYSEEVPADVETVNEQEEGPDVAAGWPGLSGPVQPRDPCPNCSSLDCDCNELRDRLNELRDENYKLRMQEEQAKQAVRELRAKRRAN